MAGLNEYLNKLERMKRAIDSLPTKIAITAVNFSKERFVAKNWYDRQPKDWQKTKKRKGSTLVASGRLKRSIRKVLVSQSKIIVGTDVPYAKVHNYGEKVDVTQTVRTHNRKGYKVKSHTVKGKKRKAYTVQSSQVKSYKRKLRFKMPKRQFLGSSAELAKRIDKLIVSELDKAKND